MRISWMFISIMPERCPGDHHHLSAFSRNFLYDHGSDGILPANPVAALALGALYAGVQTLEDGAVQLNERQTKSPSS